MLALLSASSGLLLPTRPSQQQQQQHIARRSVLAGLAAVPLVGAASAVHAAEMSPAKAKIEAAKLAQQQKLAERGYGELAEKKPSAAASKQKEAPKTFAELLDSSIKAREDITGKMSDAEIEIMTQKLKKNFPGLA